MGMEAAGWILGGWFVVALIVSLVAGRILRHTTTAMDQGDLNEVITRRKVLRYLRQGKPKAKPAVTTGPVTDLEQRKAQ